MQIRGYKKAIELLSRTQGPNGCDPSHTVQLRWSIHGESADFVHIFDSQTGYESGQEIDVFGEIGGISFSPDIEALFVGISDRTSGSVLELIEDTITDTWSCCFSQPNRVGPP
ncbi:hypothetical protein Hanom_Chr08g00718011 [Helianthus anomalus]